MKIRFTNKSAKDAVLIYPVFQKEKPANGALHKLLAKLATAKEFEAKDGQTFFLYGGIKSLPDKVVLLGLGDEKKLTVSSVMSTFAQAAKATAHHHPKTAAVILPEKLRGFAQAVAEAFVLANYQPARLYKTGKGLQKLKEQQIQTLEIIGVSDKEMRSSMQRGLLEAETTNEVRDWVNAPPNFSNAKFFDEKAQEIAKETGAKLTILRKKELEKLNMGALLGVNRGSPDEARLIVLDYAPNDALRQAQGDIAQSDNQAPIVFVGKGILFDSGGYNLKPSGYIEDMQLDKAGAAAILGLTKLLPKLNIKQRIVIVAPMTENLIGPHAIKPSEIVKTYSGKTVEVTNTDAEGRLVLADAVAYAVDKFKPKFLIDIATLTGACMIALGSRYAGLFGNDEELQKALREAGESVDELLWPMPIHKDFSEKMKGQYADLRNTDTGNDRGAGASKGAAFIKEFVGKTKWAHIDIAGPAFTNDPKKYEVKGATGFGVRLLLRFLEKL